MASYDISISLGFAEKRPTTLELLKHILLLHNITAIMAFQRQRFLTVNVKLGLHRLITVAYASRISTLDDVVNGPW